MKITDSSNNKPENIYMRPFLIFLSKYFMINKFEDIKEDGQLKTPDYLINNDTFTEIKKVVDNVETKQSARWGAIINKLKKILSAKFKEKKIKGLYGVETPRVFKLLGDKKYERVADDILGAISVGKDSVFTCGVSFSIKRINDNCDDVYLSSSWGGFINPAGTIFQNISKKLETANEQLGYHYKKYKISNKYLLLVNKYVYANRVSETIEGLSYCYQDLLKYKNIDEIYLQQETQNGNFQHTLIYSRDFITKLEKKVVEADNETHQEQFELWYWALDKMGNKQDELFDALKKFLERQKPEDIFPDKFKREAMVRLGTWLIDHNRADDAIWLINKFINDPDPGKPSEYKGDNKFDYHKQLKNNEDPTIITTVMGHLAWTVQALARKSKEKDTKNLIKAFEFTKQVLINSRNLYVIQQWTVPLIEIANRRQWILAHEIKLYKEFKKLILDEDTGLVKKYGQVPGIAKYLSNIFSYCKDLTTDEAALVISKISHVDQAVPVLIYFAIYRSNHYKISDPIGKRFGKIEPKIWDYDPDFAVGTLQKIIKENKEDHRMQTIAWNFWKIIKDEPDQFKTLEKWIDLLFALPINFSVFPYLQFILEDNIDKHPKECKKWLKRFLKTAETYIDNNSALEFIQKEVVHIPDTLLWLEKNDRSYLRSRIKKLEKTGVLR